VRLLALRRQFDDAFYQVSLAFALLYCLYLSRTNSFGPRRNDYAR
jgi:hypothetical protein